MFTDAHWHALVLMSFDQTEEVFSKNFKNHADVDAVGSLVPEMIKERDYM
jgi:hypothetical protein